MAKLNEFLEAEGSGRQKNRPSLDIWCLHFRDVFQSAGMIPMILASQAAMEDDFGGFPGDDRFMPY